MDILCSTVYRVHNGYSVQYGLPRPWWIFCAVRFTASIMDILCSTCTNLYRVQSSCIILHPIQPRWGRSSAPWKRTRPSAHGGAASCPGRRPSAGQTTGGTWPRWAAPEIFPRTCGRSGWIACHWSNPRSCRARAPSASDSPASPLSSPQIRETSYPYQMVSVLASACEEQIR